MSLSGLCLCRLFFFFSPLSFLSCMELHLAVSCILSYPVDDLESHLPASLGASPLLHSAQDQPSNKWSSKGRNTFGLWRISPQPGDLLPKPKALLQHASGEAPPLTFHKSLRRVYRESHSVQSFARHRGAFRSWRMGAELLVDHQREQHRGGHHLAGVRSTCSHHHCRGVQCCGSRLRLDHPAKRNKDRERTDGGFSL